MRQKEKENRGREKGRKCESVRAEYLWSLVVVQLCGCVAVFMLLIFPGVMAHATIMETVAEISARNVVSGLELK